MSITARLADEHAAILSAARKINERLTSDDITRDAGPVRNLLDELKRDIELHLFREDEALYPALMRHPEKNISKTAKQFSREMGKLSGDFSKYAQRWADAAAIQGQPEKFVQETQEIFAALARRIEREDNELFPLLKISA